MKYLRLQRLILLGLACGALANDVRAQNAAASSALTRRYCAGCHGERIKTVGLNLEAVDWSRIGANPELGEKVLRKVRGGEMPPAGAPRPAVAERSALVSYLETTLDRAAAAAPNPGTPALRRLNRAEYVNAVRDLLGLDVDAIDLRSALPADDSGYGFDNIGDVLSVSPLLLENYFTAARRVSRLALGTVAPRAEQTIYEVPRFLSQNDRVSEALPFGSRGGAAIRHHFPVAGDYLVKIRLKTTYDGSRILGIAESHAMDLWLDGARIAQTNVGGAGKRPNRYETALRLDPTVPNYAAGQSATPEAEKPADADFEVQVSVSAGTHTVGVSFARETWQDESLLPPQIANRDDLEPGIGRVVIEGPVNSGNSAAALVEKWNLCKPLKPEEEEPCAWKMLSAVARRAFRRPISAADRELLLTPYRMGRTGTSSADFLNGMEMALARILVSPEFLFRIERDPPGVKPGATYRLSDLELATRLSLFLWSSIPDEPLLEAAERGRLREPAELRRQVARMLADERSRALVDNFAGQWLYLRNMKTAQPDLGEFPEFDENLREALTREMELFVAENIRADRPLTELLSADYTFLNERLARHYGIRGVYGSHFRRVALNRPERNGLLGKGGLLTVTSYANRTSPVIRGKWLLENMLGTPPPPPPPNVPDLQDRTPDGKVLPMRQAMEKHRANPACATCHQRMDPLGFALENFDAVGRWRAVSGSDHTPIDASGVTPDGVQFNGPTGLREVLLSRRQEFVSTATAKLLTYALGRGLEYYDQPTVRQIVRRRPAEQLKWSEVIEGIVFSTPFQMRKAVTSDK